jgi:glycerate 2-kinase
VLCLGGSASTDGGAGMLAALGVRFRDDAGRDIEPAGGSLMQIAEIDTTSLVDLDGVELIGATDVTNPLLGTDGAAAVFGPQKGADPVQVADLEAGLARLVRLLDAAPLADEPGAGAAGGLGFACRWLGARRVAGAEFFLDLLGFDGAVADCAVVVTGEGRIDGQTLAGKLPAVVAARSAPRPVHAVVGQSLLTEDERRRLGLEQVIGLCELSDADPSRDPELSRRLAALAGERIGRQLVPTAARPDGGCRAVAMPARAAVGRGLVGRCPGLSPWATGALLFLDHRTQQSSASSVQTRAGCHRWLRSHPARRQLGSRHRARTPGVGPSPTSEG